MRRAWARHVALAAGLAAALCLPASARQAFPEGAPDYLKPELPVERRVQDLLSRMTLEEKARQMDVYGTEHVTRDGKFSEARTMETMGDLGMGAIYLAQPSAEIPNGIQRCAGEKTRLGIPVLVLAEGLHGYTGRGGTAFPQAIGLATTWDRDLVGKVGSVIGAEARACGVHESLSPVLDLAREPRWGRTEETYGEDTYLASRLAVAMVKGMQGESLRTDHTIIAEPKHFAGHGSPEGGRNTAPTHAGEREVREVFLPVFRAAVMEGGALGIMSSYNEIDGIPCTASRWLLTDVLRGEWGFRGFVLSDGAAIGLLQWSHGTAGSPEEAVRQAVEAGVDMQLFGYSQREFQSSVAALVRGGRMAEATVDRAVGRILRVKFMLGLFENPYTDPGLAARVLNSAEHKELALQAAREAVCLLKNEGELLPLRQDLKSIAVIGPNADEARLGDYTTADATGVTVLEGVRQKVSPQTVVRYVRGMGVTLEDGDVLPVPSSCLAPPDGKGHGLRGEYFGNMELKGPPALVRTDPQVSFDWAAGSPDKAVPADEFSVRWTGKMVPDRSFDGWLGASSDDGVRLWVDGRLVVDDWREHSAAATGLPFRFEAGRAYDVRLEYYEKAGLAAARLVWDLVPVEQLVRPAVEAAKQSDVAVLVLGESYATSGEGADRADLDLPGRQLDLLKAIVATGKPVVLVLLNGRPLTINWPAAAVPAIVEAWYPGQAGGTAVADVLFGDYNPAGRLPVSFPKALGQVPLFYNYKGSARRDYVGLDARPLYPFGYGLSYTKFAYGNLKVTPASMPAAGTATVSVDVENVGDRAGDEVVQLYVRDVVSSVTTPVKSLKGFERVHLAAKKKRTLTFPLGPNELGLLDGDLRWVVEPGAFEVTIGGSSEADLRAAFEVAD